MNIILLKHIELKACHFKYIIKFVTKKKRNRNIWKATGVKKSSKGFLMYTEIRVLLNCVMGFDLIKFNGHRSLYSYNTELRTIGSLSYNVLLNL